MRHSLSRLTTVWLASLMGLVLGGAVSAEETHQLRFKFEKGASTHYAIRQQMAMEIEFNAVFEKAGYSANSIRHFQVLDVDDKGNATLELMIDRAYLSATQNGNTSVYDSTDLKAEVPSEHLAVAAMIGRASVQIKVSPVGIVLGLTPLLGQPQEKIDLADQKLDVLFALPTESLAVGEVWRESFTTDVYVAGPGGLKRKINMQREYKLSKVENNVATIEAKTKVLSPNITPEEEGQLIQKVWNGEIQFDIAAGRMLSRVQKVDGQVANFSEGKGLLTVKSTKIDVYAPAEKLAAIDLKTVR